MSSQQLTEAEIGALAEAGGAAPSGGNMQPWDLRVVGGGMLALHVDPARAGGMMDVDWSASLLGLGAFSENAAIEAAARGLELRVEPTGDVGPEEPAVRLVVADRRDAPADPPSLRAAIAERATNRKPSDGRAVPADQVKAMREAVRAAGAEHDLGAAGDEETRSELARALAEADVVRTFNRDYHEQMLSEMRWTPEQAEQTADGVDVATLELPDGDLKGLRMMRKRWFVALFVTRSRVRNMTRQALASSSHLCCITMPREVTPARLVTAGRALQRAWLTATAAGLWAQPWSVAPLFALRAEGHPDTLPAKDIETIRDVDRRLSELWQLPEDRRAIFVFRLFSGEPPSVRAVRRPWRSFTRMEEGPAAPAGAGGP